MRRAHSPASWPLAAVLLAGIPAWANAAEPPPSWVFFTDHGRGPAALSAGIDERATELSPRALDRRKRVRGDRGVDARDLAPAPAYVAAVLGTGARLRSSSRWLNAVSVEADAAQLVAIADLPGVLRLQPVARRRGVTPPMASRSHGAEALADAPRGAAGDDVHGVALAQLEVLRVPFLHTCGLTGAGVVVAVQDSGFSLEHTALKGVHVIAAHDFLNDDDIVADEPGDPEGQHNHGTMVLSALAGNDPGNYIGAAPGISVILSKTEDSSVEEPFEEDRFVEGLEWSESMGADLFTSSLGYFDWYAPQDFDGDTAVTTKAADIAVEQGLIMFSAVGNAGPGPMTLMAPSDADGVIAVGAVELDGDVAEFSSRGPTADGRFKPDIAAPGKGIWVVDPGSQSDYDRGNGTSLATPLAAGAAALLLEAFPAVDPTAMRSMLRESSSRADTPDNELGWGLLDASLPFAEFCACADDDADGAPAMACGGVDCDDADPGVAPGLAEVCGDGRDNDCNGLGDDDDPACADDGEGDAATGDTLTTGISTDSADSIDGSGTDEPANSEGAPGEHAGDVTGEGCSCGAARDTWPMACLLPWLLLASRRRVPTLQA